MSFNKIVIFGVGLIGGSAALALKQAKAARHVVGVGRSLDNLQAALDLGVIDEAQSDVAAAVQGADIVLIATPVAQTPKILEAIIPHLAAHTVITDAGSTKSDIAEYVEAAALGAANPQHFLSQFVGGHPIAGAEKSGVTAAKADLFVGKNVVLTPNQQTSPDALEKVRQMWLGAGAKVTQMTAAEHDQTFAAVSHLPHLLAFALVDDLASRPNAKQLFDFAASGFRDFTRIAASSPEMWRDISMANRSALLNEIDAFQKELLLLKTLIDTQDEQGLQSLFERASHARQQWGKDREKQ
jgi:prephenate dehydrogenase